MTEADTPIMEDAGGEEEHADGHFDEVAGYRVGHASVPVLLVVLYLLIILWALVAWIPPKGTY